MFRIMIIFWFFSINCLGASNDENEARIRHKVCLREEIRDNMLSDNLDDKEEITQDCSSDEEWAHPFVERYFPSVVDYDHNNQELIIKFNNLDIVSSYLFNNLYPKPRSINQALTSIMNNIDVYKACGVKLIKVDLSNNRLYDDGAAAVADKFKDLSINFKLNLSSSKIDLDGIEILIKELLPNPHLLYLNLYNNCYLSLDTKNRLLNNFDLNIKNKVKWKIH